MEMFMSMLIGFLIGVPIGIILIRLTYGHWPWEGQMDENHEVMTERQEPHLAEEAEWSEVNDLELMEAYDRWRLSQQ